MPNLEEENMISEATEMAPDMATGRAPEVAPEVAPDIAQDVAPDTDIEISEDVESDDFVLEDSAGEGIESDDYVLDEEVDPSSLEDAPMETETPREAAFDTPYKTDVFEGLGEIGGGYHAEAFGGTAGGRAAIGAVKAIVKPALFATRVAEEMFDVNGEDPDSTSSFLSGFLDDLNKLRDRGMVRMGLGDSPDIIGEGMEVAMPIGIAAKAKIVQRLLSNTPSGRVIKDKVADLARENPTVAASLASAGLGGYFGLIEYQPEEGKPYDWEKARESGETAAMVGAVIPAAIKGAVATGAGAKKLATKPFTADPVKIFRKAIPDEKQAEKAIAAMRDPALESKVPGVKLTVGQRVAKDPRVAAPQVAAVEDIAKQVKPEVLGTTGVAGKQAIARQKAVESIAKTDKELKSAIAARSKKVDPLYKKAFEAPVKIDDKAKDKFMRRIAVLTPIKTAVKEAEVMAKDEAILRGKKISTTEDMHFIKLKLDEMLSKTDVTGKTALVGTKRKQVMESKKFLESWLRKRNPDYGKALDTFHKMSKPINRMKVGQLLSAKLKHPVSEAKERAASFAGELTKLKTKEKYGKSLFATLTKKQQGRMESVLEDLHSNARFTEQAKEAAKIVTEETASKGIGPIGAFKPLLSAARSRIDSKMGEITKRGYQQLAELVKDPKAFADMLEKASPKEKAAMNKIIHKWVSTPISAVAARESIKPEDKTQ
jgi:hypothetical protein